MIKPIGYNHGLTLIEVLISIMLLGIMGISVMGLYTTSLKNNHHSKVILENTVNAKDLMERVKTDFYALPSWDRKLEILIDKAKEIQEKSPNSKIKIMQGTSTKPLFTIEIEVSSIGKERVEKFISYIYLP